MLPTIFYGNQKQPLMNYPLVNEDSNGKCFDLLLGNGNFSGVTLVMGLSDEINITSRFTLW